MKPVLISVFLSLFFAQVIAQSQTNNSFVSFLSHSKQSAQNSTPAYWEFTAPKWTFKTGAKVFSTPAIRDNRVIIGSEDGYLYCLNAQTGMLFWKFKTNGAIYTSPAIYENSVCFGSFDGHYYALRFDSGELIWKFKTGGERKIGDTAYWGMKPENMYMEDPWDCFLSSPVVGERSNGPVVYYGSSDGNLYALNGRTGNLIWKFEAGGSIHSTPVLDKNTIYLGSWDTFFYAVNAQTGELQWKFETGKATGMAGIQASATVNNGVVYFGARDAHFYALNTKNGTMMWKYDVKGSWVVGSAVIKDTILYVGTSDSYLFLALDKNTGKEKYRFQSNGYIFGTPEIFGNTAFFGDFTGRMYAMDLASAGKRWNQFSTPARTQNAGMVLKNDALHFATAAGGKDLSYYENNVKAMDALYSLGSIVSSPKAYNGTVYFGSADGNVYALGLKEKTAGK